MMREMQFKLFFTHRVEDIFNDNIDIHIILSNDDVYVVVGTVFTFPVLIISFAYRYAEGDLLYPVFIIQAIMFVLTFFILSHLLKVKK